MSQTAGKRLDGIDVLRGLAIFFVLMNHVNMRLRLAHIPYDKGLPAQLVDSLFWNGQRGVQVFFAVSGFLIAATSLRRWGSLGGISIGAFYRIRFARIAPLLLLLLVVLSSLDLAHVPDFVVAKKTGGLWSALIAALTFQINVLEARRGYLPPNWDILWSLSVEEVFYLFFPLFCRFLRLRGLFVLALLILVALGPVARVFAHSNEVWYEYSYLGGMDAIALGVLTALVLGDRVLSKSVLVATAIFGSLLLLLSLCFSRGMPTVLTSRGLEMSILAVGACLLIAAAAQSQWQAPVLLRPLTELGRRSYEVYLSHMFVVLAFFHLFQAAGSPLNGVPVLFTAVILTAGLVGAGVARFYSDPLNRYLRS